MQVRDIRKRAKCKYEVHDGFKFLRASQGKRCKSYEQGCANCDTWRFYDERGKFPSFQELMAFMFDNEGAKP